MCTVFFLYSLYAVCISSCRRARLSLKEAFCVIFARNCTDHRRVSPSPILFSLPAALWSPISHLFLSLFFSPFFLFRLSFCTWPCDATTLPISSSQDHLLFRPFLGPLCSRSIKSFVIGIFSYVNFLTIRDRFEFKWLTFLHSSKERLKFIDFI